MNKANNKSASFKMVILVCSYSRRKKRSYPFG